MKRQHILSAALLTLLAHAAAPLPAYATGAGIEWLFYLMFIGGFLIPLPALAAILAYTQGGLKQRLRKAAIGLVVCVLLSPVFGILSGGELYGGLLISLLLFLFVVGAEQNKAKLAGKALTETQRKAAAGDPLAQDHVAYSYYAGNGVPVDMTESYFWYSLSAANFRAAGNGETAKAQEGKRAICREQLTDEQAAAQDKRLADWRPARVGK